MNIHEIKYSLQNLRKRKLRSFLTILSILIGITAIFALLSFGIGIQRYVDNIADQSGRNKLFIQAKGIGAPGTDANFFLSKDDVNFVRKMKGVDKITGMYMRAGEVVFKDQKKYPFLMGLETEEMDFIEETFATEAVKG